MQEAIVKHIKQKLENIIKENSDIDLAVRIDRYLRRWTHINCNGKLNNYTYEVKYYGVHSINVQVQVNYGDKFIDIPLQLDTAATDYDRAMKSI